MKNVLITGGSGFIGQHLIGSLLNLKNIDHILILDIKEPPHAEHYKMTYRYWDIRENEFVPLLDRQYDTCFHLAALCKEPGFEWDEYFQTNYVGTQNVISLCEKGGVKNFIFTSTMMVYKASEERRNEKSLTSPDTAYGMSKLLAEKEIQRWALHDEEKSYCTLRTSVVFGMNEKGNFTRLYYALKKNHFAFVGRKSTVKSCIYVKDLCSALLYFMDKKNKETYNFAFTKGYSIGEIVNTFANVFMFKSFTPVIPFHVLLSMSKIFQFLNTIGVRNSIHPRRIQKLYYSTNIDSSNIVAAGFFFNYNLESALKDWKKDCNNQDLY